MVEILHSSIPVDLVPDAPLPGVRPLGSVPWLTVDEAYAAQIAYRRALLTRRREKVLYEGSDTARAAVEELYRLVLEEMPARGFSLTQRHIYCPDGGEIDREADGALGTLGRCLQQDLCIMEKRGDEHVLAAAVLCFPASWTLSEKIERPLTQIHRPVDAYSEDIARRVQRLFNGVRAGHPIWRNNMLGYEDPNLFQPVSESDTPRTAPPRGHARYVRAERQCIFRLPETGASVFSIHSYVARAGG